MVQNQVTDQFACIKESVLIVQAKNDITMQVEMQKAENKSPDAPTKIDYRRIYSNKTGFI